MAPEGGRDATNHEVAAHIGTMREDVYPPTTANRCYHIIYIPDAAMKITSKEKAQNDLDSYLQRFPSRNTSLYMNSRAAFTSYRKPKAKTFKYYYIEGYHAGMGERIPLIMVHILIAHYLFIALRDDLYA